MSSALTLRAPAAAAGARNVLLISYPFLPLYDVGSKRAVKLCRHLPEFGWTPIVLTKDWDRDEAPEDVFFPRYREPARIAEVGYPLRIIRAPYQTHDNAFTRIHDWSKRNASTSEGARRHLWTALRNGLSAFYTLFGSYPDPFVGWLKPAVEAGEAAIREFDIDAIVSICPPQTAHLVASELARRCRLPWIPMFDDLNGFHIGPGDQHKTPGRRLTALVHNRRWLRPASHAAAITPGMVKFIESRYGLPTDVVACGFDPDEELSTLPPRRRELFTLRYTGSVYPDDHKPEIFFDALDLLIERSPELAAKLEVQFYGARVEEMLLAQLAGRRCAKLCTFLARVPTAEIRALQRTADALLLFNYTRAGAADGTLSFPAKTFEYLAAGRPVLAIPNDIGGYGDQLLTATRSGVSAPDAHTAAEILARWLAEWQASGSLPWRGNTVEIARYTTREQTGRLAALLDHAISVEPSTGARSPELASALG